MELVMMFVPALALITWFIWKCPIGVRLFMHKYIPLWVTAVVVAVIMGSIFGGAMGPYAGAVADIILVPVLWFDKHVLLKKYFKHFEDLKTKQQEMKVAEAELVMTEAGKTILETNKQLKNKENIRIVEEMKKRINKN